MRSPLCVKCTCSRGIHRFATASWRGAESAVVVYGTLQSTQGQQHAFTSPRSTVARLAETLQQPTGLIRTPSAWPCQFWDAPPFELTAKNGTTKPVSTASQRCKMYLTREMGFTPRRKDLLRPVDVRLVRRCPDWLFTAGNCVHCGGTHLAGFSCGSLCGGSLCRNGAPHGFGKSQSGQCSRCG